MTNLYSFINFMQVILPEKLLKIFFFPQYLSGFD